MTDTLRGDLVEFWGITLSPDQKLRIVAREFAAMLKEKFSDRIAMQTFPPRNHGARCRAIRVDGVPIRVMRVGDITKGVIVTRLDSVAWPKEAEIAAR